MIAQENVRNTLPVAALVLGLVLTLSGVARAHCDAENGPVAVAAKEALRRGEFDTVRIWVGEKQEAELRNRFEECREVRKSGGKAQELADRYFLETAVRLHREAEGMPYTGLKPAQPLPPDIAAAEKALEKGDASVVTGLLTEEARRQTQKWFDKALEAKKHRSESVEAGREWVDAYVKYVIYVHGVHQKIQAGPAHGVGE